MMISASNYEGGAHNIGGGDGNGGGSALKKGPWTAEEDAVLMEYVKKHGEGNWNAVQRNSGLNRCGKSCRLRWANHLRPNLKKGSFSPEEERLIVELHAKYGNKWARMAALLPGRTDNEIKNYWNTRIKRHQRQGLPLYPLDVQPQHSPSSHHHHNSLSTLISPTNSNSSFTFQTQLLSTAQAHTYLHSPTSPTPPLSPLSSPSTTTTSITYPASSFTFPTQLASPTLPTHSYYSFTPPILSPLSASAPTSPISSSAFQAQFPSPTSFANSPVNSHTSLTSPPLSCPSTTYSNLPVLDFSFSRPPPILQTPLRFKRFSSTSINAADNTNVNPASPFSQPLSSLSSPSDSHISPLVQPTSGCYMNALNGSNNDFHQELRRENEKMSSLLAAMTQPELPSNQMLPHNGDHAGISIATGSDRHNRGMNKRKIGETSKDKDCDSLKLTKLESEMLEELLQEAKALAESEENSWNQNHSDMHEQQQKPLTVEDLDTCVSLSASSGMETKSEAADQLNDFNKLLNSIPSPVEHELYSNNGDISNGQSLVVTDDNIGFDLQQMASLFSDTTEHDGTLGFCSWDNLPETC